MAVSRRGVFAGLGAGLAIPASVVAAPATTAIPFIGDHQPGILTPQPPFGLVVAFDSLAGSRADLARLFGTLSARIAFLMQGGPVPERDPRLPPADSGLLGPLVQPDGLTITTSVGASLFDDRYGLAAQRPRHLTRMPRFPNDSLDASQCHGDIMLQICANSSEAVLHALRDVIKNTPDLLAPRWKVEGSLPAASLAAKQTPRNLMGFKDGTANLDPDDAALMRSQVWVDPGRDAEPAWAEGGSYQVIRIIRMLVERWDRTPLQEQQSLLGRDKPVGAPLGHTAEHAIPDYAADPEGKQIRLDAHIRLANPRTPATQSSRILRRGYNYSRGLTRSGQMDMGLLFICYQSNLDAGFAAIQARLNGEQLEEYIRPVGGGYFFALPGIPRPGAWLGQSLLDAATG